MRDGKNGASRQRLSSTVRPTARPRVPSGSSRGVTARRMRPRGNFGFQHWDPVPVGSYPAGVSAWGVHDLVGNGWEWTSTVFNGFPGFEPMASYPEYSQDFFDDDHLVVKGASPATGCGLVRRSFRNWFRPQYPYMYATFRCARDAQQMASVLEPDVTEALAQDVARGLACDPKRIPSRYLYDALGTQLFEAICELPWYTVTRGERTLLARHAKTILADLEGAPTLIELGAGNGEKLSLLLESSRRAGPATVHLIDISSTALELSERTLARHTDLTVVSHEARYEVGLKMVFNELSGSGPAVVLFLGSNIGNMGPAESDRFLSAIQRCCRPGDRLLIGADLVKPEADLTLAYDDPLGVSAAFNRNLLVRLNRELDGDFDVEAFAHHVVWNPEASRVESYLVSLKEQLVCLRGAGCCIQLAEGESIWTESSYKYDPAGLVDMAARASFSLLDQWVEADSRFHSRCLRPSDRPAMTTGSKSPTLAGSQFLIAAASIVIVVAGLREASQLVLPFLVAVFLAVVSVPLMRWLQRLGLPLPLAGVSTVLAAVGVIGLLVMLIGSSVNEFSVAAPFYQARLQSLMESTLALLEGFGVPVTGAASLDLLPVGLFDVLVGSWER